MPVTFLTSEVHSFLWTRGGSSTPIQWVTQPFAYVQRSEGRGSVLPRAVGVPPRRLEPFVEKELLPHYIRNALQWEAVWVCDSLLNVTSAIIIGKVSPAFRAKDMSSSSNTEEDSHIQEVFSPSSPQCLNSQVQQTEMFARTGGGESDIWTGSFGDRAVAIKILRGLTGIDKRKLYQVRVFTCPGWT